MKFITLIFKNPFRNRTRSILSIVGIAIGIATIVALGLITTGMEDSVQTTFNEGGAEITVNNATSISGASSISSSYVNNLKNISNVTDATGILSVSDSSQSSAQSQGPGGGGPDMMGSTSVNGIDSDKVNLLGISSINGSYFKDGADEAIIGKYYAEMNNVSIGDNVTVDNKDFEIVGIYETGSMLTDSNVYVPLSTLTDLVGATDYYSEIIVKTSEDANDTIVSDEIEDKYPEVTTITSTELSNMLDDVIGILDAVSLAISALAIIVGGIGIINTMIMSVYERTKEIGVLKSVGWKSRRILAMIMGETLVLTIVSGIVGTIFGILISEVGIMLLGNSDFSLGYSIDTFALAFGVAIIVGIIGGLYPAYKASRLAPTESLRYE